MQVTGTVMGQPFKLILVSEVLPVSPSHQTWLHVPVFSLESKVMLISYHLQAYQRAKVCGK